MKKKKKLKKFRINAAEKRRNCRICRKHEKKKRERDGNN